MFLKPFVVRASGLGSELDWSSDLGLLIYTPFAFICEKGVILPIRQSCWDGNIWYMVNAQKR